jgi:hypothetical protein
MTRKKKKRKIIKHLTKDQLRHMMENKLRAKTIESSTLYKRSKNKHSYYED